jgi:hypothetical protein
MVEEETIGSRVIAEYVIGRKGEGGGMAHG